MTVTHLNDCTCCAEHIACATPVRSGAVVTKDPEEVTCKRCPGTVRYSRHVERLARMARIAEHAPAVGTTWKVNGHATSTIASVDPLTGVIKGNAIDPLGHRAGDEWTISSWIFGIANGYIRPAPEGTEPIKPIRRFELIGQPAYKISSRESRERFKITGAGVHNRLYPHAITGFAGRCCDVWIVHLHLSAEPIVIAPGHVAPVCEPLAIGEVIEVDHTRYRVVVRRAADPILVPLGWDPEWAPELWKRNR